MTKYEHYQDSIFELQCKMDIDRILMRFQLIGTFAFKFGSFLALFSHVRILNATIR
jgi:hypothetical protein